MVVTFVGNFLAFITCGLPQWRNEKWASRKLSSPKTISLTRGNGYHHIIIIKCPVKSWDLEALASGFAMPCWETTQISLVLAILWVCLLISVSGLKEHDWYLVSIGSIGMLQNIYAAGVSRGPGTAGLHVSPSSRASTIIGQRGKVKDDPDGEFDLKEIMLKLADVSAWATAKPDAKSSAATMPLWLESMSPHDGMLEWLKPAKLEKDGVRYGTGVQGALIELEK